LGEVADEVREGQKLIVADKEAFYRFIGQLVVKFAKEAKRRGAEQGQGRE